MGRWKTSSIQLRAEERASLVLPDAAAAQRRYVGQTGWLMSRDGMDDLSRPLVIAAVVGVAAMTFTIVLGFLTTEVFLLGGQRTCPEGLCGLWMYLGLLGAGLALPACGIAAGFAARRAVARPQVTRGLVWRAAVVAATAVWAATMAVGLTCLSLTGPLPPGPTNLLHMWFGR